MTTEATLYEVRNGAAWITLNRPENRNALSATLVDELHGHLTAASGDTRTSAPSSSPETVRLFAPAPT